MMRESSDSDIGRSLHTFVCAIAHVNASDVQIARGAHYTMNTQMFSM